MTKLNCPYSECPALTSGPISKPFVRKGSFFRRSDGQRIPRFLCLSCRRTFSSAALFPCFLQKKRRLNSQIFELYCSGISQRRLARVLKVNRKTVVRKLRFLAHRERVVHAQWMSELKSLAPLSEIQFDDLETSEHSKCKPLSVALAVNPKDRKILGFQVSSMPAKGLLAKQAAKKYGYRTDERPRGWDALLSSLTSVVHPEAHFRSDQNPHYPVHLKRHFPLSTHETTPGLRGCIAGQGELKRAHFDPLFSLNHTCAMLRANLNRLFRKTWCTTKTRAGLIDHLSLYVGYHNRFLTSPCTA